MCTLSLTPTAAGLRLCFNRDERRSRPVALPPVHRPYGLRRAIHPTDPQSGGTWLATNDAGLTCAILNRTPRRYCPPEDPLSRGTIIPSLLHHDNAIAALADAEWLDPSDYPPFRLVLLDPVSLFELVSDGRAFITIPRPLSAPLLFTSSGLGDDLVAPPRRALFEQFSTPTLPPGRQDAFHRHRWPDRPHLSVFMSRPDAATVSITTVDLPRAGPPTLTYTDTLSPPEAPTHDLCAACR